MTPEEIVGLIVNFANRPDLREVQERQIREIKELIAKEVAKAKEEWWKFN